MKRIKKISLLTLSLVAISLIIQSCCEENFKIIGKGTISAYNGYKNDQNKTDTLEKETTIYWHLEYTVAAIPSFGLIQNCYATSCAETFENELIESTIEISCNKEFAYNGKTIDIDENFINIEELEIQVHKGFGAVEVKFTQDFLDKVQFDNSVNIFSFKVKTTDNKEFVNSLNLFVK